MITILVLMVVGLGLSAFFSGSETGFYRVPRVRLVIDGVGGDRIAQGLLWASNHPEAFVATALVGNNVANYIVSFAIVSIAQIVMPASGIMGELALTLLLTPVVFVFGELLPKRAFLQSPYRLLRSCTPALLVAGILLSAASILLWLASRMLSLLVGSSNEPLRMTLRRRELADVFTEGHAAGLLSPAQRDLAMATFSLGGRPVRGFMVPIARQPRLPRGASADELLRLARKHQEDAWPIELTAGTYGAVRASRTVIRSDQEEQLPVEPLPEFHDTTSFLQVITHMESHAQPLAAIRGPADRIIGFVRLERLQQSLLGTT